ncbi:MAG: hypothetical protein H7232_01995 [Aeromicrobium sp.]|nr:hypothetical protein [Burkholderiales bacterium]
MQLISEHLDSVILHQVRSLGLKDGLSAQRLNWLSQVPAGEVRARRFQALVAAPLLLPMLIRTNTDPDTADVESNMASIMNVAIERGDPLFPLLSQHTGPTERTVRHLRTAALREHHLAAAHELHTAQRRIALLSWLELIPIERWPQTLRQWKLWVRVTVSLLRQVRTVSQLLGDDPRSDAPVADFDPAVDPLDFHANALHVAITHPFYLDLAAQRWKLTLGPRHDFKWDREDGHAMDTVSYELRDFIRALQSGGQDHPDDMDTIGYVMPASVGVELRGWTITAWWAASDRWHQFLVDAGAHFTTRVSIFSDDEEILHWLALSRPSDKATEAEGETEKVTLNRTSLLTHFDFLKPEFRRIEFLSNSRALLEEGSAMDHCVSARVDDCLTGRTHIASLTDRQGRRCSTLAVRLDYVAGGWYPVLTEHRTVRNGRPDDDSVVAVEQLMGELRQPAWQAQYVLIEAARAERETALRARLPKLRNRAASLHLAALQAALPKALLLQINRDGN